VEHWAGRGLGRKEATRRSQKQPGGGGAHLGGPLGVNGAAVAAAHAADDGARQVGLHPHGLHALQLLLLAVHLRRSGGGGWWWWLGCAGRGGVPLFPAVGQQSSLTLAPPRLPTHPTTQAIHPRDPPRPGHPPPAHTRPTCCWYSSCLKVRHRRDESNSSTSLMASHVSATSFLMAAGGEPGEGGGLAVGGVRILGGRG